MNPKNCELISHLVSSNVVQSKEVKEVMESIDRGDFCNYQAYVDRPQTIGFQATISAPHMHAYALVADLIQEFLKNHLKTARKSLDVGSGSGYLTLAFAKMMPENAVSFGIEHIPELVSESINNISKNHRDLLELGKVVITEGDGRNGLANYGPYDAIHVGAGWSNNSAAEEIYDSLKAQLAPNGRMVKSLTQLIPVNSGNYGQDFLIVDKDSNGEMHMKKALGVSYVPLTSKEKQLKGI